jgi:cytochrome c556
MKQVPLVHAALKRSVDADRWRRQSAACQGQAAALAAIAAVSALDHEYAKTPAENAKWDELCGQMRDAAGAIGVAIKDADRTALAEGMSRLHVSCEACHAAFRRP